MLQEKFRAQQKFGLRDEEEKDPRGLHFPVCKGWLWVSTSSALTAALLRKCVRPRVGDLACLRPHSEV